ncbi:MAG: hypothetical protein L6R48_12315 [Planctomycetes bacterium]|nr:hypothetical protein [Planctomycetota bacterium]
MATDPPLWSVRRRPPAKFLLWSAVPALAIGGFAAWLLPHLMIEPVAWPGVVAGIVLIAAVMASVAQGAGARVATDGTLVYTLRGTDMWQIDLHQVEGFAPLSAGMLSGIAVRCDPAAVTHVSRKGPTRDEHLRLHRELGVGAVMEHLHAEDLPALEDLRRRFALAPPAPPARSSPA